MQTFKVQVDSVPQPPNVNWGLLQRKCLLLSLCVLDVLSCLSHVRLFAILWTVALQAPLSMRFSRQEYWMGCHIFLQGLFPIQESNPHLSCLLCWRVNSSPLAPPGSPTCPIEGAQLVPNTWPSLCLSSFHPREERMVYHLTNPEE